MRTTALSMVLLLASCTAPAAQPRPPATNPNSGAVDGGEPEPEARSPTPEIDAELGAFRAAPYVTLKPDDDVEKRVGRLAARAKPINDAWKAKIEGSSDRDRVAHAHFGRAQLYLVVACRTMEMPAPEGVTDAERETFRAKMRDAGGVFLMGVETTATKAVEADGQASGEAGQMLLRVSMGGGLEEVCGGLESYWRGG